MADASYLAVQADRDVSDEQHTRSAQEHG